MIKIKTNTILNGDALQHLKTFPDESIDCVMTSPPYWALRDYGGTVEVIWDGDGNCEHNFQSYEHKQHSGRSGVSKIGYHRLTKNISDDIIKIDGFCSKCQAWKGQLGLEPIFDLYIDHLCDIFDEVKRVLKKSGTCWINLGDNYSSQPPGNISYAQQLESSGWDRPSRRESYRAKANKMCRVCGKKFVGNVTRQFCSTKCLNTIGNDERTKNRQLPDKCLTMIPFRFAIEMINRGWILRNTVIWHKPNCMPSSVKDRFTVDFEYIFFFVKKKKYYFEKQHEDWIDERPADIQRALDGHQGYNAKYGKGYNAPYRRLLGGQGIKGQPVGDPLQGRNKRTVWKIPTQAFPEAHFAVYPEAICEIPIKAGCPREGIVLDPFFGTGTTGLVALKQNKQFIGIELNPEYIEIAKKRLKPYLEQTKLELIK